MTLDSYRNAWAVYGQKLQVHAYLTDLFPLLLVGIFCHLASDGRSLLEVCQACPPLSQPLAEIAVVVVKCQPDGLPVARNEWWQLYLHRYSPYLLLVTIIIFLKKIIKYNS